MFGKKFGSINQANKCSGHGYNLHLMTDDEKKDLLRRGVCPACPGSSNLMIAWHPDNTFRNFPICSCCEKIYDVTNVEPLLKGVVDEG